MFRFLIGVAVALAASPALAQPASPFELVRGLREQGMPDLALDYLADIEKASPPADVRLVLPLERAFTQLAAAQLETDEATRDAAVARAKGEFEAFLKGQPKHPRAVEATVALARVLSLEAKAALNRAARADAGKPAERAAAAAATRPLFRRASDLYGQAAERLAAALADADPGRKRGLARDALQAEFDRGVNQYNLADTYLDPRGKEVEERAAALADAKKVFAALGQRDASNPVCWSAKAWAGACDLAAQDAGKAEEQFKLIRAEAARNPAAADGVRMAEFFDLQTRYVGAATAAAVGQTRRDVKGWLDRDKHKARMTPERLSMTYYHATLLRREAEGGVKLSKDGKAVESVSTAARALLAEASREYKKLLDTDNDYTDRAGRERGRVIRLLVGTAARPAAEYTSFDECQMAAVVQLGADENKEEATKKAVELLERCRKLATAAVPARDRLDAELMLAFAYLNAGRPAEAAVLGEHLARTARGPAAARAGFIAIDAYLAARGRLDDGEDDARAADRDRAIAVGRYIDAAYPTDPATDAVRFRLGRLLADERRHADAVAVLGKVSPTYPSAAAARVAECRSAFAVLVSKDAPPADKQAVLAKAVADAEAVPEPGPPDALKGYFALRTLLAQLHLASQTPAGYAKAEQVAADAAKRAAAAPTLGEGDRKAAAFAADEVRLRAVYAQAAVPFRAGRFADAVAKLRPSLADVEKAGPAVAAKLEGDGAVAADNLDRFRREAVALAMQAEIRQGAVEPAAQLFELLDRLGGSVEATTDALARLTASVRPQADELRRAGKADEADKLASGVAALVSRQASKPTVTSRARALLGRSLRELGAADKAIEVLKAVPVAPAADLKTKSGDIADADRREAVVAHAIAQLELARAHRQARQYDAADAVLRAALGTDKEPGWAKSFLEYRKEAVLVTEDRAVDAPADARNKLWGEARAGWTKVMRDYYGAITAPLPKEEAPRAKAIQDREKLVPVYVDLQADEKRCLCRMVASVYKDQPAKVADSFGKIAQQVVDVEKGNAKSLTPAVKRKFADLLADYPQLKDEYAKRGGVAFLNPDADE